MHHHGPPGERLDLVSHSPQQLAVGVDRVQLGRRELEREGQEQALGRGAVARDLAHHCFVQHPLVRRVLVHDRYPLGGLEQDVGVEHLEQRWGSGLGTRGSGVRRK